MLQKEHRLKKRRHFSFIYKKGNRISSKYLTLTYIKSRYPSFKIGFSVSKKIGKANVRNKVKRRMREICRKTSFKGNRNYIFTAREGIENLTYNEIESQIKYLLSKIND